MLNFLLIILFISIVLNSILLKFLIVIFILFRIIVYFLDRHYGILFWYETKKEILEFFKDPYNRKAILIGFFSLVLSFIGLILNLTGFLLYELSIILKYVFKVLSKEFGHLKARLSFISIKVIFILYFLPVLLTSGALYYWRDEPWEIALERLTPELWELLIYLGYCFFVCFVTFIGCHDWAKNSVINKSLTIVYGKQTPRKTDHWFLRFCYWLHPETYVIGRLFHFHIIYIVVIYTSYYILLGFYTFKGVLF